MPFPDAFALPPPTTPNPIPRQFSANFPPISRQHSPGGVVYTPVGGWPPPPASVRRSCSLTAWHVPPRRRQSGVVWGSFGGRLGVGLGSFGGRFGVVWGSVLGRFRVGFFSRFWPNPWPPQPSPGKFTFSRPQPNELPPNNGPERTPNY